MQPLKWLLVATRLQRGDQTIFLVRRSGVWQLPSGESAQLDESLYQQLRAYLRNYALASQPDHWLTLHDHDCFRARIVRKLASDFHQNRDDAQFFTLERAFSVSAPNSLTRDVLAQLLLKSTIARRS